MVRPPPPLDLSRDFGMRLSRCCAVLCALDRFLFHDAALGSTENLSLWIPSFVGYHACNSLIHCAVNKGRFRNQRALRIFFFFFFFKIISSRRQDYYSRSIMSNLILLNYFWSRYIFYTITKYIFDTFFFITVLQARSCTKLLTFCFQFIESRNL